MAYVTINGKRNMDWGLDFLGKTISAPEIKKNTVDIPLRDGIIDLTEDMDGIVRYKNRTIEMRFEIRAKRIDWPHLQMELFNAYHGQRVEVIFDDDSDHYWTGRASVSAIEDHTSTAGIKVIVDAEPFRRLIEPIWKGNIELSGANRIVLIGNYGFVKELGHPRGFIDLDMGRSADNNWVLVNFNDGTADYRLNYASVYKKDVNAILPGLYPSSTLEISSTYSGTQKVNVAILGGDL